MKFTVNEYDTFLICDEFGDIPEGGDFGLYRQDTRFLSALSLRLNGEQPLLLTAKAPDHRHTTHFFTNPGLPFVPRDTLGIVRERELSGGVRETIRIRNYGLKAAPLELQLDYDADFAHIFEIKMQLEPDPERMETRGTYYVTTGEDGRCLEFGLQRAEFVRRTVLRLSEPARTSRNLAVFERKLAPGEEWLLTIDYDLRTGANGGRAATEQPVWQVAQPNGAPPPDVLAAPRIDCDRAEVEQAYRQALSDLASLRLATGQDLSSEFVLAAGIPWFLALFGRDTLITSYQTRFVLPEAAKGALRTLARYQGQECDPLRDEEPGKILHEHRLDFLRGKFIGIPGFPYYGSIDATPLFIILLSEIYRTSGDLALVRELAEPLQRALSWLETDADLDGDGFVEYHQRHKVGLINQGWKDSLDSIRFHDGRLAEPPIALCEVQGYAYDALLRAADLLQVLGNQPRARACRGRARALRERFNKAFWLPRRGYYAEALDREKQPVDALTSNVGHLLWSGIVPPARAASLARHLTSPAMFSGWGVRTMAANEPAYNPISYHNGSVWPHDNSLIAAGLARSGQLDAARQVMDGLFAAIGTFPKLRPPELFAGYPRNGQQFAVEYPSSCSPQAWASGAVVLMITTMLGLEVDAPRRTIQLRPCLLPGMRWLRAEGLRVGDELLDIEIERDQEGLIVTTPRVPEGFTVEGAGKRRRRGPLTSRNDPR